MATVTPIPANSRVQDLTGQRFGRLTVVGYVGTRGPHARWLCRCDCGGEKAVTGASLKAGKTSSCGCLHKELTRAMMTKHGAASHRGHRSPEYRVWVSMIGRCHNPTDTAFPNYGGRGITVCDEWRHGSDGVTGFERFLAAVGPKPTPKHSIERNDNSRGYQPDNCRWATRTEQNRNNRRTRLVTFQGREMSLAEACELAAVPSGPIRQRLGYGWSFERAITTPIRPMPPRGKGRPRSVKNSAAKM